MSTVLYEALPCGVIEWHTDAWYWILTCLVCQQTFAVLSFPMVTVLCPCGQLYQLGGISTRIEEPEV